MKKIKLLTSLFFLSIILLGFGVGQEALALKKIGDACTESNECESNTCDDSYCTCGDTVPSNHCAQAYGGTAADWKCVDEDEDPDSSREEWNFCKKSDYLSSLPKTSTADVKYPVEKKLLMGQPCIDTDACLSGNGHGTDICNETELQSSPSPGDPLYDPWYTPGKMLNICTPPPDSFRAPDMCEYQYGDGDWDWNLVPDNSELQLRGMRVCKKDGSPIMTTLVEMRKSAIKDVNSVETTFLGFDISTEAPELVTPTTKIGIPGVFFTNITKATHITTDESGASWLNIPFLGEFISAIYKYSVGLISLIAVMVLIISGVQIITSAGNSEAISSAKHRIVSSVIAIVITAGSYTILYTVNPDLVNLKNLKIFVVEGKSFQIDSEDVPDVILDVGLNNITALSGASPNIPKNLPTKTNSIPYLIGPLPSSIKACSAEAFQYTAQKLHDQNVCVGSCHCGYTASHFLNYIGCSITYEGFIPTLRKRAIEEGWKEVVITKDNANNLPVGLAIMTSAKSNPPEIHAGISIGNGAIFDSSAKETAYKKVNAATGNTCPPPDPEYGPLIFSIKDPNDNTQNCSGCSRIPSEAPATGRFASKYYTDPNATSKKNPAPEKFLDSLIRGTNPVEGCKGIQVWAIRKTLPEVKEFNYVYVPPQLVQ